MIGGRRVPKYHSRIEAYGTVDELMAHTSLLRDMVDDPEIREELLTILDIQMATASVLAADFDDSPLVFRWWGRSRSSFWKRELMKWMLPWSPYTPLLFQVDIRLFPRLMLPGLFAGGQKGPY